MAAGAAGWSVSQEPEGEQWERRRLEVLGDRLSTGTCRFEAPELFVSGEEKER